MGLVEGLASVAACVALFGTFAVPLKAARSGDGVFFQWVMCSAIFAVGCCVFLYQCSATRNAGLQPGGLPSCPQFVPLVASGGAIWCLANLLLVPLVDTIGVGMTMMLWGIAEMFAGWATARFGWFGVTPEAVVSPGLNYAGVAISLASLALVLLIRPDVVDSAAAKPAPGADAGGSSGSVNDGAACSTAPLLLPSSSGSEAGDLVASGASEVKWTDRLSPAQRRGFGSAGCLLAGMLSGSTFTPAQHVVDATLRYTGPPYTAPYPGASTVLVEHLFAHFTGIWLSSTLVFGAYLLATSRGWLRRQVYTESLGAYAGAGLLWGTAMLCWFLANANLEIVVSFPIVTMGPGIVATLWGLWYREFSGRRNYALLLTSIAVFIAGSVCIVASKV